MRFILGMLVCVGGFTMISGIVNDDNGLSLAGFGIGVVAFALWYFIYFRNDDGIPS